MDLPDKRKFKSSVLDRYKSFIRQWIENYMEEEKRPPYKLLYRVLQNKFEFKESYDSVRRYVIKYFPDFHKKSVWFGIQTPPGVLLFVDWKEDLQVQMVIVGNWIKVQTLVFSLGFSGKMVIIYFDSRTFESLISSHQRGFIRLGGLAQFIRPDCLKSAVKRWRSINSELNNRYESYLKRLGVSVFPAPPGKATDKGKIEKRIQDFFNSIDFRHKVFKDMKDLQ